MILITGMPRSGTTFLHDSFAAWGHLMTPKIYCESRSGPSDEFSTDEPNCPARAFIEGVSAEELVERFVAMERVYDTSSGELLIKHPWFIFRLPEIEHLFSKVILCWCDVDRWVNSVKTYPEAVQPIEFPYKYPFIEPFMSRVVSLGNGVRAFGIVYHDIVCQCHTQRIGEGKWSWLQMRGDGKSYIQLLSEFGFPREHSK